jgi:hypothetical protein
MARGCRAGTILCAVDCHPAPGLGSQCASNRRIYFKCHDIALDAAVELDQLEHQNTKVEVVVEVK